MLSVAHSVRSTGGARDAKMASYTKCEIQSKLLAVIGNIVTDIVKDIRGLYYTFELTESRLY